MTLEKLPCKSCGAMILPLTATRFRGRCVPCSRNPKWHEVVTFIGVLATGLIWIPVLLVRGVWGKNSIKNSLVRKVRADKLDGFLAGVGSQLYTELRKGDEVWEYRSPPATWRNLSGRAGYCLARKGKIVAQVCTLMN